MLVNLSTSVQAIMEEGFLGSRILTLDGNGQRSTKLSDWIREHKGVHFKYPFEETTEGKEPTGSNDQRFTTLELEPLIRMVEVCSEEDFDIPDSSMLNVEKKAGQKDFDGDDSTTKESIGQSEAYHTKSGKHDEPIEETATKAVSRRMK